MWYVYILRSQSHPGQRYIGLTEDMSQRLARHNAGESSHTSKFRPWSVETLVGFSDQPKAIRFERYLKTGSGYSFAKRHF